LCSIPAAKVPLAVAWHTTPDSYQQFALSESVA
jgi:hypothetical protein